MCFAYLLQLYLTLFERGKPVKPCEQSSNLWKIFMLQDNPQFPEEEHSECCEFMSPNVYLQLCLLCGGICVVVVAPIPGMYWASFYCVGTKGRCVWVRLQSQSFNFSPYHSFFFQWFQGQNGDIWGKMLCFFSSDHDSYLMYYYCFLAKYIVCLSKALWWCSLTKMKNIVDDSSAIHSPDSGVVHMLIHRWKSFGYFQIRGMQMWLFASAIPNSCSFDQFVLFLWSLFFLWSSLRFWVETGRCTDQM